MSYHQPPVWHHGACSDCGAKTRIANHPVLGDGIARCVDCRDTLLLEQAQWVQAERPRLKKLRDAVDAGYYNEGEGDLTWLASILDEIPPLDE